MDHPAPGKGSRRRQHLEPLVIGVPQVDDQRQIETLGHFDLVPVHRPLDIPGGEVPVEVEADLTIGHRPCMTGQLFHLGKRRIIGL